MLTLTGTKNTRSALRPSAQAGVVSSPGQAGISVVPWPGRQSPWIKVVETPIPSTSDGSITFARTSVIGSGCCTGGQVLQSDPDTKTENTRSRLGSPLFFIRIFREELEQIGVGRFLFLLAVFVERLGALGDAGCVLRLPFERAIDAPRPLRFLFRVFRERAREHRLRGGEPDRALLFVTALLD